MRRTAGNGAGTAALAQRTVDNGYAAIFTDAVVVDELCLIADCAVGADVCALRAAVAEQLVALSGARVRHQLILREQTDGLNSRRACLRDRFRNILRALAYAGEEYARRRGLDRAQLCVSLGEEVIGIDAGGQHGRNAAHVRVRLNRRCEDNHIRFHQDLLVVEQVNALHKQLAVRLQHDLADLTLDVVTP